MIQSDKKDNITPVHEMDYERIFTHARAMIHPLLIGEITSIRETASNQITNAIHPETNTSNECEVEYEQKSQTHVYHFNVSTGGGTYITQAATTEDARQELQSRWPYYSIHITQLDGNQ